MMVRHAIAMLFGALFAVADGAPAEAQTYDTEHYAVEVETVADDLAHPWGLAFLPDGEMLVTERPGQLRVVSRDGRLSAPLRNVPEVYGRSQGGLLDVAVDPGFGQNNLIYISYAEPGAGGAGTAVARAVLNRDRGQLTDLDVIFRQEPKSRGGLHFGSRLVFAPDGTLFITVGERGQRERAQDPSVNRGQVIRINTDGSIPADNPFVGVPGHRPEIWSYGHRNPQGAALHPVTGEFWIHEHGARGGDEVNVSKAGKNYGWPVISYGRHYSGAKIGVGTHKEGMEQPVFYWDPSIAPSGMAFYTGDAFPEWKGDLLIGALKFRLVSRLSQNNDGLVEEEWMLNELNERIRDVRQGPDGLVYLLTDSPRGRILRLSPAGS